MDPPGWLIICCPQGPAREKGRRKKGKKEMGEGSRGRKKMGEGRCGGGEGGVGMEFVRFCQMNLFASVRYIVFRFCSTKIYSGGGGEGKGREDG